MKFSVNTIQQFNTFDKVMTHFTNKFVECFKAMNINDGKTFLHDLGEFLDDSEYPINKIQLNVFTGYNKRIGLIFWYNDEKIAWIELSFEQYGIVTISNYQYLKKDFQIFHHIVEQYFDVHNQQLYDIWVNKCNIYPTKENAIKVNDYTNYKPNGKSVILSGSLEEVFEKYATHNDMLKYCNGEFWKFDNQNIDTLYRLFKMLYKGNYSLHIALKRGVIID